MMEDLIAWTLAHLDIDEQVARAAEADEPSPWVAYGDDVDAAVATADGGVIRDGDGNMRLTVAQHVARWDPARVLALTAALRRIFDEFSWEAQETTAVQVLTEALYADRAGYREEWRP